MITVQLTQGYEAKIDPEDMHILEHRWIARINPTGHVYAARWGVREDGTPGIVFLHREICKPERHLLVDHINGDTLDNRRSNLRAVTPQRNALNRKKPTGVSRVGNRWRSSITLNGKKVHLGYYATEEEARKARQIKNMELGI